MPDGGSPVDVGPKPVPDAAPKTGADGATAPSLKDVLAGQPQKERLAITGGVKGGDGPNVSQTAERIEESMNGDPEETIQDLAAGKLKNPEPANGPTRLLGKNEASQFRNDGGFVVDGATTDEEAYTPTGREYQAEPADGSRTTDAKTSVGPASGDMSPGPQQRTEPSPSGPSQTGSETAQTQETGKEPALTPRELIDQAYSLAQKFGDNDKVNRDIHADIGFTLRTATNMLEGTKDPQTGQVITVDSQALLTHLESVANENALLMKNATTDKTRSDYQKIIDDTTHAIDFIKRQNEDPKAVRATLAGEPPPKIPDAPEPQAEKGKESEVSLQDLQSLFDRIADDYADEGKALTEKNNTIVGGKSDLVEQQRAKAEEKMALAEKYRKRSSSVQDVQLAIDHAGTGDQYDKAEYRPNPGETIADSYARRAQETADKAAKATDPTERDSLSAQSRELAEMHKFIKDANANPDSVAARINAPRAPQQPSTPDAQTAPKQPDQSASNTTSTPDKPDQPKEKTLEERHNEAKKRMDDLGITIDKDKAAFVNEALGDPDKMKQLEAVIDAAAGKGESLAAALPPEVVAGIRNKEFHSLVDVIQAAADKMPAGSKRQKDLHWILKVLAALAIPVAVTAVALSATGQFAGQRRH